MIRHLTILQNQLGYFTTKKKLNKFKRKGFIFVEDAGRGYRRVVPSPQPISIIELESIKTLIKNDTLVIAAGGGGIPVIREQHDGFKGIDAVIDKDKTSALLGANIQCDQLIILTAIDYVYINFNTENQQPLKTTNVDELKRYIDENQFAKGSMLPKIEAAISFIENNPKGSVLITSLNELDAALEGKVGTVIKK